MLGRRKYDNEDDAGYDQSSGPRGGKRQRTNDAESSVSPAEQLEATIIRFTAQVEIKLFHKYLNFQEPRVVLDNVEEFCSKLPIADDAPLQGDLLRILLDW